ncbi:MAG: ABC transporter ATP-binding protein [Pseudomonadota bacterium]
MTIYQHAKAIINFSRDTFWVVFIYAMSIALLSLVVPIAAQSLVNVVSFGTVYQPVVILTIIVFVVLTIMAGMRVAQAIVVETIQQRLFTEIGLKLANLLPKISIANFDKHRVSELVNRFFEVQTIQKALAVLLVTGIEICLLTLFSMLLIAFYHPLLLAFDILLIFALALALWLPWKKALKYAIAECEAKHTFAAWLEEIVHNIFLFKMQSHADYALDVADEKIADYLIARKKHFASILKHIFGVNIIYVLANAALLGIGGYLVIREQLSLGELVASELIVNALLYGFVRFSFYLEDLYDLLASCYKLASLTHIPCETTQEVVPKKYLANSIHQLTGAPKIEVTGIKFATEKNQQVFDDLSFAVPAGKSLAILGNKGTGKSLIVDLVLGFRQAQAGVIKVNELPIQQYNLLYLRQHAALVRRIELFSASILENLLLQRTDISLDMIHGLLRQFNVANTIEALPEGLDTFISGSQMTMSSIELKKLMFIRAILTQPKLFIIDGALDNLPEVDLQLFLPYLKDHPSTLIITTRRQAIANYFDQHIIL